MQPKTVGRSGGRDAASATEHIAGLPATSSILTVAGERPVGSLQPGQRVITRDSGTALVRSVRRLRIVADAVRIRAGSLGHTREGHDTTLPAAQLVLVRDWRAMALFGAPRAIVPAAALIDGEFITLLGPTAMDLCIPEFDRPHVLYVDGLEVAGQTTAPAANAIAA